MPSCRRDVVTHLQKAFCVSERCACRATGFSRATQRYRSHAAPQGELRLRLKELAQTRVRYGYRRLHVLLRREGWTVNAKRIYRLYKEDGLVIRPKTPRRKRSCRYRGERPEISAPNQTWAMDFMSDTLVTWPSTSCTSIVPPIAPKQCVSSVMTRACGHPNRLA